MTYKSNQSFFSTGFKGRFLQYSVLATLRSPLGPEQTSTHYSQYTLRVCSFQYSPPLECPQFLVIPVLATLEVPSQSGHHSTHPSQASFMAWQFQYSSPFGLFHCLVIQGERCGASGLTIKLLSICVLNSHFLFYVFSFTGSGLISKILYRVLRRSHNRRQPGASLFI